MPASLLLGSAAKFLADFLRSAPTLLVMDGLESIQYPPSAGPRAGQLRDPGIASLLRGLALDNRGLCVLTTRHHVADLTQYEGRTTASYYMPPFDADEGAELLQKLGVQGQHDQLKHLSPL